MKKLLKYLFAVGIICTLSSYSLSQTLYKVSLYRAAPGQLLTLIDEAKSKVNTYEDIGGDKPFIVRHSQGDQWDLMVYEHIGSYQEYFDSNKRLNEVFSPPYGDKFYDLVSHHENIFTYGPSYNDVKTLFEENGFFHVEMFVALPGEQSELIKQRNMENIYLQEIGRGQNLIFTTTLGANWDCFTLGGYKDIKHFAESADIPLEREEKAAIKAGFKGVNDISPYLRSLIDKHNDTLGGKL